MSKLDLEREGSQAEAQAHNGAFLALCMEGHACRIDAGDTAAAVLAWRPQVFPDLRWEPPPYERAMMEVARRFFSTYGPASETDLRHLLSTSAAESRAAVRALRDSCELEEVTVADGAGSRSVQLVMRSDVQTLLQRPPPAG